MSSLAKTLLASIRAASFDGPKTLEAPCREGSRPARRPAGLPGRSRRGRSPPSRRSGPACRSRCGSMGTLSRRRAAVPALPGRRRPCSARGDCASFQTRACSRPPLPMTSTFIMNWPGSPPTVRVCSAGSVRGPRLPRDSSRRVTMSQPDWIVTVISSTKPITCVRRVSFSSPIASDCTRQCGNVATVFLINSTAPREQGHAHRQQIGMGWLLGIRPVLREPAQQTHRHPQPLSDWAQCIPRAKPGQFHWIEPVYSFN